MGQAPEWTNQISNNIVCGFYYVFFIVFAVWAAISLLGGIWIYATTKMTTGMLVAVIFNILLSFGISATHSLFLYLMCDRALQSSSTAAVPNATARVASASDYVMM